MNDRIHSCEFDGFPYPSAALLEKHRAAAMEGLELARKCDREFRRIGLPIPSGSYAPLPGESGKRSIIPFLIAYSLGVFTVFVVQVVMA